MHPPFTVQQFFGVFRLYNTAVWPAPVLLLLLLEALILFFFIGLRRPRSGAAVSTILAVLRLWVGIACHWAFFAQINPVADAFHRRRASVRLARFVSPPLGVFFRPEPPHRPGGAY